MTDDTLRHAVGDLIVGGFAAEAVPAEFSTLVTDGLVGGAILFSRNLSSIGQAAELVAALRSLRPDLWISVDQEGGRVQRLEDPFPQLPPMRVLGRRPDAAKVVASAGAVLADGLLALGFDQDYAPVLDVDTNPDNPVIGDRAFAAAAADVAKLGVAFARALEGGGIAGCGKHFPGHGDTVKDSHLEMPRLDHDLDRLRSVELVPFAAAAAANIASIMTAHVIFGPLDATLPATLSHAILQPILRRELGYDGVVVSDDLEMKAIADNFGIADAAVRAIGAGCDQLLVCHRVELQAQAHAAIVDAVQRGRLERGRVLEAHARVKRMKARFQRERTPPTDLIAHLRGLGAGWTEATA